MANINVYTFDNYKEAYNKVFAGVYNDFRQKAFSDYKFELEPLEYSDFVDSINAELVKCIILFEQDIPTGFLTYTTVISESLELNIIHVIGNENSLQKRCLLMQKFLEENTSLIAKKVVTYPVLGKQEEIVPELSTFGFKTVNQSVMRFDFQDSEALKKLREKPLPRLNNGFETVSWNDKYYKDVVGIIHNAFKKVSDSKFDPRFNSIEGTADIVKKIVMGTYGEFLQKETKILLYKSKPVGVCFANLTNNSIANVPIVALKENLRGKSYGIYLLKSVVIDVYQTVINGEKNLTEINASCDSDFIPAFKMYKNVGFQEFYTYKQAYRSYK
ncbi:hypothetical protein IJG14_06410 [bacterium]|nr:hypothetical protein [bacterium]